MSSPWGTLRQKHSSLFQSTGTGKTHGTHSLSPFQVHAGVWFGDQKVRRRGKRRGRMHQKEERRKRGGRASSPKHPRRPSIAHSTRQPDCVPQGRAQCPSQGPGNPVPHACLHIEDVPVLKTKAYSHEGSLGPGSEEAGLGSHPLSCLFVFVCMCLCAHECGG